jgi:YD repeat-containing protein
VIEGLSPLNSSAPVESDESSASVTEVLYDQLDYLVSHTHEDLAESSQCPDCARLFAVRAVLLRPFIASARTAR